MSSKATEATPFKLPAGAGPPSITDSASLVDYTRTLDCIHCGLCLNFCPTYRLTGAEQSSPRGRIHLMRAVAEGRLEPDRVYADEMSFCLGCLNCESVCPAGVQYGQMLELSRDGIERAGTRLTGGGILRSLARRIGFGLLLPRRGPLRLAITGMAIAQRLGLIHLIAPFLGARGEAMLSLPPVPPRSERKLMPEHSAARGEPLGQVAVLEGCVMPELFGRVNRATVTALNAAGLDTRTPQGHVCCGALHAHNGELEGARDLARKTIEAFDGLRDEAGEPLPIVVNSAGCGAHMRAYGHLFAKDEAWRERAQAFDARVVDFSELLAKEPYRARLAPLLQKSPAGTMTYDDPCHLCHGQGVREEPRTLLDLLPGVERVELEQSESCCGSAGIYSMLRPQDSQRFLDEKLAALSKSGAQTLVTANPGCHMQWAGGVRRAGLAVEVLHVAEIIERALDSD